MAIGTAKWFNATKGFGFIQPDAGGAGQIGPQNLDIRSYLRSYLAGARLCFDKRAQTDRQAENRATGALAEVVVIIAPKHSRPVEGSIGVLYQCRGH